MIIEREEATPVGQLLAAAVLALACCATHAASAYPSRPIRLIVPFPPGGSTDVISRLLAERLAMDLGQAVIVDNRPGASGNLGSEIVARAAPDGHTLLMATVATLTINQSLYGKLKYDPARELAPLSTVATAFQVLLAHPSLGVRSVPELISAAKAKPGGVIAASASNGTTGHLSLELLKMLAKIDVTHVPYKGAGPAQVALLGGQVQILFDSVTTAVPHIRAARVRALGVTRAKRSALLPDVPSIGETVPGFETTGWFAMVAPASTPRAIQDRLARSITTLLKDKEVISRIESLGAETMLVTGPELDRYVQSEREKWARVIRQANITVD
ncbi:MAG: transporter [Betaproteobacteria bacterium]|nr:transporter [Betaproteobacteria bacterium]